MADSQGRIPKPYVNDTKVDRGLMEYVSFEDMSIGARKAGMPPSASTGPKSIEHVGKSEKGPADRDKR